MTLCAGVRSALALLAWACLLGASNGHARVNEQTVVQGRVVRIMDGDTLEMRTASQTLKIRLAFIDAPEKKQPFGQRAKQALSDLCFGQWANAQPVDKDRYGRTVATVECQGRNANQTQVAQGMAWVYRKYAPSQHPMYQSEQAAQAQRKGLWADANPTPPWEWRHAKRTASQSR